MRVFVSLNRLRRDLDPEGKLFDVGILHLGLAKLVLYQHLILEPIYCQCW